MKTNDQHGNNSGPRCFVFISFYLIEALLHDGFVRFSAGGHEFGAEVLHHFQLLLQAVDFLLEALGLGHEEDNVEPKAEKETTNALVHPPVTIG